MSNYILLEKNSRWNQHKDDVVSFTKSNIQLKKFPNFNGRVNVLVLDNDLEIKIVKDVKGSYNIKNGVMNNKILIEKFGKSLWRGKIEDESLILTKI